MTENNHNRQTLAMIENNKLIQQFHQTIAPIESNNLIEDTLPNDDAKDEGNIVAENEEKVNVCGLRRKATIRRSRNVKMDMAHESTNMANESTNMAHERTNMANESTNMAHDRTNMANESTNMVNESTNMANERTKMANESTNMANECTNMTNENLNMISTISENSEIHQPNTLVVVEDTLPNKDAIDESNIVNNEENVNAHGITRKAPIKRSKYVKTYMTSESTKMANESTNTTSESPNMKREGTNMTSESPNIASKSTDMLSSITKNSANENVNELVKDTEPNNDAKDVENIPAENERNMNFGGFRRNALTRSAYRKRSDLQNGTEDTNMTTFGTTENPNTTNESPNVKCGIPNMAKGNMATESSTMITYTNENIVDQQINALIKNEQKIEDTDATDNDVRNADHNDEVDDVENDKKDDEIVYDDVDYDDDDDHHHHDDDHDEDNKNEEDGENNEDDEDDADNGRDDGKQYEVTDDKERKENVMVPATIEMTNYVDKEDEVNLDVDENRRVEGKQFEVARGIVRKENVFSIIEKINVEDMKNDRDNGDKDEDVDKDEVNGRDVEKKYEFTDDIEKIGSILLSTIEVTKADDDDYVNDGDNKDGHNEDNASGKCDDDEDVDEENDGGEDDKYEDKITNKKLESDESPFNEDLGDDDGDGDDNDDDDEISKDSDTNEAMKTSHHTSENEQLANHHKLVEDTELNDNPNNDANDNGNIFKDNETKPQFGGFQRNAARRAPKWKGNIAAEIRDKDGEKVTGCLLRRKAHIRRSARKRQIERQLSSAMLFPLKSTEVVHQKSNNNEGNEQHDVIDQQQDKHAQKSKNRKTMRMIENDKLLEQFHQTMAAIENGYNLVDDDDTKNNAKNDVKVEGNIIVENEIGNKQGDMEGCTECDKIEDGQIEAAKIEGREMKVVYIEDNRIANSKKGDEVSQQCSLKTIVKHSEGTQKHQKHPGDLIDPVYVVAPFAPVDPVDLMDPGDLANLVTEYSDWVVVSIIALRSSINTYEKGAERGTAEGAEKKIDGHRDAVGAAVDEDGMEEWGIIELPSLSSEVSTAAESSSLTASLSSRSITGQQLLTQSSSQAQKKGRKVILLELS